MKTKPTLEDHMEMAYHLAIMNHHFDKFKKKAQSHFGKSTDLMKAVERIEPLKTNSPHATFITELENDYHRAVKNDQFVKYGNIYHNSPDRDPLNPYRLQSTNFQIHFLTYIMVHSRVL